MDDDTTLDVQEALADLFLDTETRTGIPRAARLCVEAGLTVAAAYDVWRYQVTPVVWRNLWDVAGEWALWPRDWLAREIRARHGTWPNRPGLGSELVYRLHVGPLHACWLAVAECMRALAAAPDGAALCAELTWLAEQYFDFCASRPPPAARARLRQVYDDVFTPIFAPLAGDERAAAEARVGVSLVKTAG